METRGSGIFLKRYIPKKNKVSVLDYNLGRIDCFVFSDAISVGSLASYTLQPSGNGYFLNAINVQYMPFSLAYSDLLFLHHILEVCHYSLPIGACVEGIFDLFVFLYTNHMSLNTAFKKQLFLFKLLSILGLAVEDGALCSVCFHVLHAMPIDRLNEEFIQLDCEKKLARWLRNCIGHHPLIAQFKTVHFLQENRVV